MSDAKRRPRPRPPITPDDCEWANAQGTISGLPAYLRINATLEETAPWRGYDHEVMVAIKFNDVGETGMPTAEEDLNTVDEIEDRVKERLEADGKAILALVLTSDGRRELYFYTVDAKEAVRAWEEDLEPALTTHHVEIHVRPDAEWGVYRRLGG
jgi:hypothetical protein